MFTRIFAVVLVAMLSAPALAENLTYKPAPAPIESAKKENLKYVIGEIFKENGKMQEACNDPKKGTALNTPQCREAFDQFRIFMMEIGETLYCGDC